MSIWRYEAWDDQKPPMSLGFSGEDDFIDMKATLEDRGARISGSKYSTVVRYNTGLGPSYTTVAFFWGSGGERIVVTRRPARMGDM